MFAFKAAIRRLPLVLTLLLVGAAPLASAADGSGYLGVSLQDLTPALTRALQLDDRTGVLVSDVIDDSPAEKAGLEDGDVILEFDGKDIADGRDLTRAVRAADPGDKVDVVVLRGGKRKTLAVELGERDDDVAFYDGDVGDLHESLKGLQKLDRLGKLHGGDMRWFGDDGHRIVVRPDGRRVKRFQFGGDRGFMGVQLDDVEGQMTDYFGVDAGALVTGVNEDSPAEKAGLKAGDVIVAIADETIESAGDVHEAMSDTEPGQEVEVKVVRKGDDKTFKVTLGEASDDWLPGNMRIFGDDDRVINIRTPHVWTFSEDEGDDAEVEVFEDDHPRFRVHRTDDADMEDLRRELKELRQELQDVRKDLRK